MFPPCILSMQQLSCFHPAPTITFRFNLFCWKSLFQLRCYAAWCNYTQLINLVSSKYAAPAFAVSYISYLTLNAEYVHERSRCSGFDKLISLLCHFINKAPPYLFHLPMKLLPFFLCPSLPVLPMQWGLHHHHRSYPLENAPLQQQ